MAPKLYWTFHHIGTMGSGQYVLDHGKSSCFIAHQPPYTYCRLPIYLLQLLQYALGKLDDYYYNGTPAAAATQVVQQHHRCYGPQDLLYYLVAAAYLVYHCSSSLIAYPNAVGSP